MITLLTNGHLIPVNKSSTTTKCTFHQPFPNSNHVDIYSELIPKLKDFNCFITTSCDASGGGFNLKGMKYNQRGIPVHK